MLPPLFVLGEQVDLSSLYMPFLGYRLIWWYSSSTLIHPVFSFEDRPFLVVDPACEIKNNRRY